MAVDCSDCIEFYKERKQKAPCGTCPINWYKLTPEIKLVVEEQKLEKPKET